MKAKKFELIDDGKQTERFTALAQKLVKVPKTEIDKRIAAERRANAPQPKKASKA